MSQAFQDGQPPRPFNPRPNPRTIEEDRAWASLYASVDQACTAEEVAKQLDADVQARQRHLALYVRARTTLRARKAVDARNQRIAAFVRSALSGLLIAPYRMLRSVLSTSTEVAVEMLPPARRSSDKSRVRAIARDPDGVKTAERFVVPLNASVPPDAQHAESRGAKAA